MNFKGSPKFLVITAISKSWPHWQNDTCCILNWHSVESPSMVDPQWNIWYWGSKWNLHTICWSAVGCEWGTTSVYFGITYVCFIPSRLPALAVEPQYLLQYFLFLSKVSFELHIQNLQKISCCFKIWMGFVGPILIKLWPLSIWGFLFAYANMLVTTQWPLKRAATSPHLSGFVFYGCLESLTELSALWNGIILDHNGRLH